MPMIRRHRRARSEPTIALINIVFLMLIFFMVAGTLAPPLDRTLSLVKTADLDSTAAPDAIVVHSDGRLQYQGEELSSAAAYIAREPGQAQIHVRLIPDRDLAAAELVRLARAFQAGTGAPVFIVTERALE